MPDANDLLLVKSGGPSVFHEWVDGFAASRPGLAMRDWDDGDVRDDEVTYVLVGQPVPGRLARMQDRGAGLGGADRLLDHLIRRHRQVRRHRRVSVDPVT